MAAPRPHEKMITESRDNTTAGIRFFCGYLRDSRRARYVAHHRQLRPIIVENARKERFGIQKVVNPIIFVIDKRLVGVSFDK